MPPARSGVQNPRSAVLSLAERGPEVDIADLLTLYGITDPAEREQSCPWPARLNSRLVASISGRAAWLVPGVYRAGGIRGVNPQLRHAVRARLAANRDYAAAVIALGEFSIEETERLVFLRKERQRRFTSGGLRLTRSSTSRAAASTRRRALMRAQLEYLLDICDRPAFTLQVTPQVAAAHVAPASFSILQFAHRPADVVYVEHLTSALYLDKSADVVRYKAAWTAQREQRFPEPVQGDHSHIARGYGRIPMSSIRNGMPATELTSASWIKSRRSGPTGGNCVESRSSPEARSPCAIHGTRTGRPWFSPHAEWEAFLGGAGDGEFGQPGRT